MSNDRRAIFQLLAVGRISPAQAERLMVAASAEREAAWAMAACAVIAVAAQLQWLGPQISHVARMVVEGGLPVVRHVIGVIGLI